MCPRRRVLAIAAACVAVAAGPAQARQYHVIRRLPAGVAGNVRIDSVDVAVAADAATAMVAHDAKAAARAAAQPPAAESNSPVVAPSAYARLPFTDMFPRVFRDVAADWRLDGARPVKVHVTIDAFQTANFGRAMAGGSRDAMSGLVEVEDAATGANLGLFTVRVVNRHFGWSAMVLRGSGIRQRLAEEFALESARVLSGRKSRTPG